MASIPYGIDAAGAKSVSFSSGREMFRCGAYVRVYITNVTVDTGTTTISCVTPNVTSADVCPVSIQGTYKDQMSVNWNAKSGADSGMDSGAVLNKAVACGTGGAHIYTHTEGQVSVRVQCALSVLATAQTAFDAAKDAMFPLPALTAAITDWILADISIQASVNDWQGGSLTLSGISSSGGSGASYKGSYNFQSGIKEVTEGIVKYDESDDKSMITVLQTLYT